MKPTITSFIALAREDLTVAKKLLPQHRRHAAFLIEQAAEKLLKAILTAEEIVFATSHHQLGALAQLLPVDHIWRADVMTFDSLTSYATALRYPTPGGRVPESPEAAALGAAWRRVSDLVGEIEDWCRERTRSPDKN